MMILLIESNHSRDNKKAFPELGTNYLNVAQYEDPVNHRIGNTAATSEEVRPFIYKH